MDIAPPAVPVAIVRRIEVMQADLAVLREQATGKIAEAGPMSIGELAIVAFHLGVIATALGILHKAFRLVSQGSAHV